MVTKASGRPTPTQDWFAAPGRLGHSARVDRLAWTARALLAAALVSGCGKTGAGKQAHDRPTSTAGLAGQASGGAATAGQAMGGAGNGANMAGSTSASGTPASAGNGGQSTAGAAGTGSAGSAGAAGAPPMKACTRDANCAELQVCEGGFCRCPSYSRDFCDSDQTCTSFEYDANHCGGCHACAETETCNDGVCGESTQPLTTFPDCGDLLLQPATPSLYVLDTAKGTLFRVAFDATDAPTPVATGLTNVNAFALSADAAYVATKSGVQRVTLASGAISTVTQTTGPVKGVAVAGGRLFYSVGYDLLSIDASAQAAEGSVLATGMNGGSPNAVVISGDFVLFNADGSFNIEGVELGPGRHFKLSSSQNGMFLGHRSLLTDGQYVYWEHDGFMNRSLFASNDTGPRGVGFCGGNASAIAFTPQATYCGDKQGQIAENRFGASTARGIARNLGKVTSLVVEDHELYIAHGCQLSSLQL